MQWVVVIKNVLLYDALIPFGKLSLVGILVAWIGLGIAGAVGF